MFGRPLSSALAAHRDDVPDHSDDDTHDDSDSDELAESLAQLRHNFKQLVQQKEAMVSYCDEMHETVEQKEALVARLNQKLREVKMSGGNLSESEADGTFDPNEVPRRKRRVLPRRPGSRYSQASDDEMSPGRRLPESRMSVQEDITAVDELQDRVDELETECRRLTMQLEHKEVGRSLADEMLQDKEIAAAASQWEEEHAVLTQELQEALEANATLKDLLDETTAELESVELELERYRSSNAYSTEAPIDLSTELSESLNSSIASPAVVKDCPEPPVPVIKGMTYTEQAEIFKELLNLKEKNHDLECEVTDAKAEVAKNMYERELQTIFLRNRDRILIKILGRRLSWSDRERVIQMLKTTGPEAASRLAGSGKKPEISSPVSGTFRKIPLEESLQAQVQTAKQDASHSSSTKLTNSSQKEETLQLQELGGVLD